MAGKFKRKIHFRVPEFLLALFIILSGLALGFSGGGFILNFNKIGFTVFSSMQKGVHAVSSTVVNAVTAVYKLSTLQSEYKELSEKLKDYEFMQRNNAVIRKENERLREQLGFASNYEYKNIACQIIARDPDNIYSAITINKGARHGIKKGMPVIAIQSGNVGIVGKVVTVGLGTSMVMPLYNSKCNISARVQNTRDIGIVSGNDSESAPLKMRYVRRSVINDLHYGDVVITSGENDNYMRDIPIGRISSFKALNYDTSLAIEIDPIIDFNRLETVLVVDTDSLNDRPAFDDGEEND